MTDKHLINAVEDCVRECLFGFSRLHPNVSVECSSGVVFDPDVCEGGRVGVVSGGGSGHEPFPAGFVGEGMLTASVSGEIFTSPPSRHVLDAIRLVAGRGSSVLLLVPNYTGDVLNFGLAAETAAGEGVAVESVVVGDDVSQEGVGGCRKAGRRGMCGLVLVMKVAGYLSRRGDDLGKVKEWSREAVGSMGSMGLCVGGCSKPGVGLLFCLGEEEVEVGVGVHGEAGVGRWSMVSGGEAVRRVLDLVLPSVGVAEGDEVVGLVNNLGSLSVIEEWLLAGELEAQLSGRGVRVARLFGGRFFTSLNMPGVQICILRLKADTRETFLAAFDDPTTASGWNNSARRFPNRSDIAPLTPSRPPPTNTPRGPILAAEEARLLARTFTRISRDITRAENRLNELDSVCGDGDCGTTFSRMAGVLEASGSRWKFSSPLALFSGMCSLLEESVGGTTGALYGLFLRGVVGELARHETVNGATCAGCWRAGLETIKKYSSARVGDRTMLDSLELGCRSFESCLKADPGNAGGAFTKAVKAAVAGCQQTKTMKALAGRASYTDREQTDVDAGAYAVTVWLSAIQEVLNEDNQC